MIILASKIFFSLPALVHYHIEAKVDKCSTSSRLSIINLVSSYEVFSTCNEEFLYPCRSQVFKNGKPKFHKWTTQFW